MAVYKKKNRWYIDYYLPDGKRKREVVKIPGVDPKHINRQDALKALSIRKAEIAEGKFNILKTDKIIKFEKLLNTYLDWAKDNHRDPKRDIAAAKHLLAFFKGKNISQINLWQVEKYKSERKDKGMKPETINKELGILRRMFNLGVQWKIISLNPITGIKLLKAPKTNPRVLKDWEFEKLYEAASSHFRPILLCAYMTGMRSGEIANLKWENVDLEDEYIEVIDTKNNESRSIPTADSLLGVLKRLNKNSESELVFTRPDGKQYKFPARWKTEWAHTLKKAGIGKCRFHDMRHTFTSKLIVDEKEDYATVMALTGHRDITMLQRYSHTKEEAKKAAIKKLGNRLRSSSVIDTYLDTSSVKRRDKNQ